VAPGAAEMIFPATVAIGMGAIVGLPKKEVDAPAEVAPIWTPDGATEMICG